MRKCVSVMPARGNEGGLFKNSQKVQVMPARAWKQCVRVCKFADPDSNARARVETMLYPGEIIPQGHTHPRARGSDVLL